MGMWHFRGFRINGRESFDSMCVVPKLKPNVPVNDELSPVFREGEGLRREAIPLRGVADDRPVRCVHERDVIPGPPSLVEAVAAASEPLAVGPKRERSHDSAAAPKTGSVTAG